MRSTKIIKICSSSLCTSLHHMVIFGTRNNITDFLLISAWASPFNNEWQWNFAPLIQRWPVLIFGSKLYFFSSILWSGKIINNMECICLQCPHLSTFFITVFDIQHILIKIQNIYFLRKYAELSYVKSPNLLYHYDRKCNKIMVTNLFIISLLESDTMYISDLPVPHKGKQK